MTLRRIGLGLWSWCLLVGFLGACATAPDEAEALAEVNQPPLASFSIVCINRACSADAESSSDDGNLVNYAWSWGDGATTTGGSSASAPSHSYATFGTFTVTLTVTDNEGLTGTTTRSVAVVQAPTAAFGVLCSSFSCLVNASASSGPAAITSYHWDWGDETTSDVTTPSTVHTYSFGATFQVHLRVTDANGRTGGFTRPLTVPVSSP